jgi:hypothetical protein
MPARVLIHGLPKLLMDAVAAILAQAPGVVVVARQDGAADNGGGHTPNGNANGVPEVVVAVENPAGHLPPGAQP